MKRNLLLLYILVLPPIITLNAQSCLQDGIRFSSQAQLDSFKINFPNCTKILGDVEIWGNDITNLDSLGNLDTIGSDLTIIENPMLISLAGLDSLECIQGSLRIYGNTVLTNLSGLENLRFIGEWLTIGSLTGGGPGGSTTGNPSLENIASLSNLNHIGNRIWIMSNPKLSTLQGLENIDSISFIVYIRNNGSLKNLEGLSGLHFVESLSIERNDSLVELTGLNSSLIIGNNLSIILNSFLSTCEEESICKHLENSGDANIGSNANGCNSEEEVKIACEAVSVEESIYQDDNSFLIYPNPTKSTLEIRGIESLNWEYEVFDISGKLVQRKSLFQENTIDVSKLVDGLYLLKIQFEDGKSLIRKFVKE
ncbi:MAG: T9SS type A sorting domain-containing protein [Bacteroidetes bacterium]|nr:T9SS type A sorting domain-containing protein [Bacteroidota bacterium]